MSVCHYKSIPHVNVLTEKCPTCPCVTMKVSYMSMCHHESVPHMGWVNQTRLICTRPLFKNWYGLVVAVVRFCIRVCLFCVFSSSVSHPPFLPKRGGGKTDSRDLYHVSFYKLLWLSRAGMPFCLWNRLLGISFCFYHHLVWDQSGGGGGGRFPFPVP